MPIEPIHTRSFGPGEFPALMRELVRRLATGRWDVTAGGQLRQLWLESGEVRAVVSDAEDEKLGKWLVAQGLLDSAQMALALLRQPDGVRFGTFLVQQGLLDGEVLEHSLEALATDIVARLLTLPGEHAFAAGDPLPDDAATIEMTTASVVVAAVRRIEDVGDLEPFLPAERYACGTEDARLQYQRVQLVPEEAFLFSRVDGSATVSQLRRVVPLPREAMTRCLAALVLSGMVELRATPGPRPAVVETAPLLPLKREPEKNEASVQFTPDQQHEYREVVRLAGECRLRDYYRRLGLTHGATLNQVHERFREFVQVYHPDRASEPHLHSLRRELAEINGAIQEAYETLINPEKRARYTEGMRTNPMQTAEEQVQDDRRQRARRELARANVQRAQALIRAGDFGAAVQLLDEAVRAEPNAESLLLLARLEQRNPMWTNRVLDHLRMSVTLDPEYTDAWLELAAFWGKRSQKERQRQCLEKILAYDPVNGEVMRLLDSLRAKK
jgi:curved DNA-binding protein CbpA